MRRRRTDGEEFRSVGPAAFISLSSSSDVITSFALRIRKFVVLVNRNGVEACRNDDCAVFFFYNLDPVAL